MERPNPNFLYDTTPNLEYSSPRSSATANNMIPAPVTPPSDRQRSRFDQYQNQQQQDFSQSPTPMISITEDNHEHSHDTRSSISDILPSSASSTNNARRLSMAGGSTPGSSSQRNSFYGGNLEAAFANLNIPGGNVPGNRNSISALKYTPQPSMPARDRSPPPAAAASHQPTTSTASSSTLQSQPMSQQPSSSSSNRTRSPARNLNSMMNRNRSQSPRKFSPFNFKSTNLSDPASHSLTLNPPTNMNRASHRKGHRYKHSSVSMNIIPEPKIRAPLKVHASYTIPNLGEFMSSLTPGQKWKLIWSCFHLFTSLITFLIGFRYGVHSFSTLSHLIFYDSLSCIIVVLVNVMANFDVWGKSSIKFPFGLGRLEVLFGFALSISLIFVGCDLLSHFMEEVMASVIISSATTEEVHDHDHGSGHTHHGGEVGQHLNIFAYEIVLVVNIVITLISSQFVVNSTKNTTAATGQHDGITQSKIVLKNSINNTSIISNPSHLVTLVFATYLMFQPLILNIGADFFINEIFTLLIASFICYMGWRVVKYLGYVILLSFPGTGTIDTAAVNEGPQAANSDNLAELIKTRIMELDEFKSNCTITNLIISKVHMKLIIVLIKIKMYGGSDDEEVSLRLRIHETVLKSRETLYSTGDNSATVEKGHCWFIADEKMRQGVGLLKIVWMAVLSWMVLINVHGVFIREVLVFNRCLHRGQIGQTRRQFDTVGVPRSRLIDQCGLDGDDQIIEQVLQR
ncbi:hypothetical protein WICPIJ_003161 [Wickerhamomyces pijperi]|uniref:Protein ZRG17 n=1 Tax=Wickerhamomyces pijperi TaxID=599730 RepID=A0A9P8QA85_WICPI|nr:hypothetical protein WICPIJ_003161 [Wickerhamomyces pijperi]